MSGEIMALIGRRIEGMSQFVSSQRHHLEDQRHLNTDSAERAYWHHGYLMALKDVRRLMERDNEQT